MKNFKRVVIGIKMDEDDSVISELSSTGFLKIASIHIVHVSRATDYSYLPNLNLSLFPTEESKVMIEEAVMARLNLIKNQIIHAEFQGKVTCECLFSDHPKKAFSQYANDIGASLVILMEGKKHAPFGSFLHYQLNHAKAPLLILRPSKGAKSSD